MRNPFYLQRNDRQAITALLIIAAIALSLIIWMGGKDGPSQQGAIADSTAQASNSQYADKQHPLYYKVDEMPHELFFFDPNTADSTELIRLGLQPWQVRNIYHYRAKGGIYREANDFARLYGLTKKQFEILRPYIKIGEDYKPAADYYGGYSSKLRNHQGASQSFDDAQKEMVYSYPQKLKSGQHIAINTADTTELKKIPGIGSSYARAIVRYREQLGGFVSIAQLKEIEGFPEEALAFANIEGEAVKKLAINKLTLNQLRRHPYINFYQAREICDYRRLKGPIKSLQALALLKDFPPAEIERLQPYVSFE